MQISAALFVWVGGWTGHIIFILGVSLACSHWALDDLVLALVVPCRWLTGNKLDLFSETFKEMGVA